MKLSFFIDTVILLLLLFFLKRKKLNLHENIFLLMVIEFIVTSYCAILYINIDMWSIADQTDLFIIFRIYEVVIYPVIWLEYFNLLHRMNARYQKGLWTFALVGIQIGIEQWLRIWGVIVYKDWSFWQSIIIQFLVLLLLSISLYWYRKIEGREKT